MKNVAERKCASSVSPIILKPLVYQPPKDKCFPRAWFLPLRHTGNSPFTLNHPSIYPILQHDPSLCFQWFHVTWVNRPLVGWFSNKLFSISLPNSLSLLLLCSHSISLQHTVVILAWVITSVSGNLITESDWWPGDSCDCMWPDFTKSDFVLVISYYIGVVHDDKVNKSKKIIK